MPSCMGMRDFHYSRLIGWTLRNGAQGSLTPELARLIFADVPARLVFIRPLSPSAAVRPPKGDDWLHEPKWDGFRFQVIKDGNDVRLYSKSGAEYSDRLPGMVEAFTKLPTQTAVLDGELCLIDPSGGAHFYRLSTRCARAGQTKAS